MSNIFFDKLSPPRPPSQSSSPEFLSRASELSFSFGYFVLKLEVVVTVLVASAPHSFIGLDIGFSKPLRKRNLK